MYRTVVKLVREDQLDNRQIKRSLIIDEGNGYGAN